jgi:DNA-binding CsgD family transcriptional regulator
MDSKTSTASALLAAIRRARERGGAEAALRACGIDLSDAQRFEAVSAELDESSIETLALGFLAAHAMPSRRARAAGEPTSFVMDEHLVVRDAEGESILRLPWFEDGLFVGRQLPDIAEMPAPVRNLCIENYTSALRGERGEFAFTSYGHAYAVEAVPVRGEGDSTEAVLAIATPTRAYTSAGAAYERTAERFDRSAEQVERRAELHARAGRRDDEATERRIAERAREVARRARVNARRLQGHSASAAGAEDLTITPREADVLRLGSHGLTYSEIAAELAVTPATVRTHLENAYANLGVGDKAAAVAAALRHGLIE